MGFFPDPPKEERPALPPPPLPDEMGERLAVRRRTERQSKKKRQGKKPPQGPTKTALRIPTRSQEAVES